MFLETVATMVSVSGFPLASIPAVILVEESWAIPYTGPASPTNMTADSHPQSGEVWA